MALWQSGLLRFPVKKLCLSYHEFKSHWCQITLIKHLKKYYGINNTKAINIIIYLGLQPNILYNSIPKTKLNTLIRIINFLKNENSIELPLKNKIKKNIKLKIDINSIAGKRHRLKYPVRGQRTRCNGRTAKKLNHNIY